MNLFLGVEGCKETGLYSILFRQLFLGKQPHAVLAQQVERVHGKDEVTGSNPVNGCGGPTEMSGLFSPF